MIELKNGQTAVHESELLLVGRRFRSSYWVTTALLLMMALGAVVRVINLGYPTFFMDEYDHVYAANSINETGKPLLPSGQPYTRALPFTYMVAASFRLFGMNETSARLPSVVFGILMIPVTFMLGRVFFSAGIGLLAALLVTCLVLPVEWSRACRMYTLFAFLYGLAFVSFYRGFEPTTNGGKDYTLRSLDLRWLAVSMALLAAAYTVQMLAAMFVFGVAAYCLVMAVVVWRRHGAKSALASKYGAVLGAFAVGAGALAVSTDVFQRMWQVARECPAYAMWKAKRYDFYVPVLLGNNFERLAVLGAVVLAFRGRRGAYLLTGLIAPLLFHTFLLTWKSERYILYLYPLFAVTVSVGALTLAGWIITAVSKLMQSLKVESRARSWVGWASAAVTMLVWLATYQSLWQGVFLFKEYHGVTVPHVDWRGVAAYLKEHAEPTDAIAASVPLAIMYYAGRKPEYSVRRFEAEGRHPRNYGRVRDRYAGSLILEDVSMVERMMERHARGWFIVDVPRWNKHFLSQHQQDLVLRRMTPHPNASDGTVRVYSWGR